MSDKDKEIKELKERLERLESKPDKEVVNRLLSNKVKIQICRKRNLYFSLVLAKIRIDGIEVATVGNGKTTEIFVDTGKHELAVLFNDETPLIGLGESLKETIEFEIDKKTMDNELVFEYELKNRHLFSKVTTSLKLRE